MTSASPVSCSRSPVLKSTNSETSLAVQQDVAERVEEQIACEVRDCERAIVIDADEASLAATMGNVDLSAVLTLGVGGDEEGIGRHNHVTGSGIERNALLNLSRERFVRVRAAKLKSRSWMYFGQLPKLWSRSKASPAPDVARRMPFARLRRRVCKSIPSNAIASPSCAPSLAGSAGIWTHINLERARRGRRDEARLVRQHRRPCVALAVDGAHDDEGNFGEEFAVLVGHKVAHHALARDLHPLAHASLLLDSFFSGVPY